MQKMSQQTIRLSRKQNLALKILNDPQIVDILFGGGAGGAKTLTICSWMLMELRDYPGIRIGLGRKELSRLKQTTVVTLLREAHKIMGISEGEFKYSEHKGLVEYINGSSIQLVDLAYLPSDPDFDRFGSLNFTHTVIEEAGEVPKKGKDVFTSRKNRFMNDVYGIVGKSLMTCNPSQNFLKIEYYKPYKKLGAGEYQKWDFGQVEVEGVMKQAYRAFIRSLATDNPFLPRNYIEVLRSLPLAEKKRLLEGNWDYKDNDLMLFPSSLLDRITDNKFTSGERFIGVDVADTGTDETIFTLVEDNMIVDQKGIKVDTTEAIGDQIALEIIKYAQQNGLDASKANHIGVDVIGVGASTRDFLRSKGWRVFEFVAGSKALGKDGKANPMFRNLRGQAIYKMSQEMDQGTFKIYSRLTTLEQLREQLMAHEYETEERRILITPKSELKKTLGRSPDHAESAYIAFWVSKGNNDPRHNTKRIIY